MTGAGEGTVRTVASASPTNLLTFYRQTTPMPDGRVRVQIQVRLEGPAGKMLLGRISPARRPGGGTGWRYMPMGAGRQGWKVGEVWPTAEECKQSLLAGQAGQEKEAGS